jgi:hypothetical protein
MPSTVDFGDAEGVAGGEAERVIFEICTILDRYRD